MNIIYYQEAIDYVNSKKVDFALTAPGHGICMTEGTQESALKAASILLP